MKFFSGNVRAGASGCVAVLLLGTTLHGQNSETVRSPLRDPAANRTPDTSDLAKNNLSRVAASAVQIRVVLRDAGLMVELKQWIAREATDNGQVVEESDLSDQAIFDRLDQDLNFRSIATRLLQRYGYLLPTPNPDSSFAKEEDLVLKERARRLVQVEAQEDEGSLRPERRSAAQAGVGRTSACDPQWDQDCGTGSQNRQSGRQRSEAPNNDLPTPDIGPPLLPDQPSPASPVSPLRAGLPSGELGEDERMSASHPELEYSSAKSLDAPFGPANSASLGREEPANGGNQSSSHRDYSERTSLRESMAENDTPMQSARPEWKRTLNGERGQEETATPVKMVRRANPYADIPSLYDMYVQASTRQRPAEKFGMDVFRNHANDPQAIPMDLPVGPDYVVGTGDSLSIDIWGSVAQRLVRLVDREGRIALPETGPLLVTGKNLGEVQLEVQHALRSAFRDVSADVSVARLRTVRVYVIGEVAQPGAYDISSLSTPLNALFAAGGVTSRGSMRSLQHLRGKELLESVDVYDLLLHGVRPDLKRLENGDTLLVPPVGRQATVEGMVRRPAVYELLEETSLAEVLELAGGILPAASLRHVEVQRLDAHQKRTMLSLDLSEGGNAGEASRPWQSFTIQDGDQVHIFPIAAYNEDAIYLEGHVLRPGRYSYKPGMKVADLISSYGDLLPEPAPHYAEIIRLNAPDFRPSIESFDVSTALANPTLSPALQPMDTVRIFSRYDFEPPPEVWVGGEVRAPGSYHTSGQARLRDALYLAGGITADAALDAAQLFRSQADGTLRILSVNLREALAGNPRYDLLLEPRDRLLIHRALARVDAPTVNIQGEVAKPGRYPLTSNMRVEDLVQVAGGLKRSAFAGSADLTRFAAGNGPGERLEVKLKLASATPGDANAAVTLRNGDVLTIRQIPQWNDLGASVKVRGEVEHPATYGIEPGERLSSLLKRCDGFTPEAYPYGAVLLRREVQEFEMSSHLELVNRLKAEQGYLKAMPEADADQKQAKLTALAQTDTALEQLEATPPAGRVVIHIPTNANRLSNTASDLALRDGDVLIIPKKANYVVVSGQVFHPTAVGYLPGRSAKWYLSQSGGLTQIADRSAVFVVRADGSVLSAKNNSALWSGDPLSAVLKPGDAIMVPEKAPKLAPRNWATLMQAAQVASSAALTVAYIHP